MTGVVTAETLTDEEIREVRDHVMGGSPLSEDTLVATGDLILDEGDPDINIADARDRIAAYINRCTCPPMWPRDTLKKHHPKCPMREVFAKVVPDLVSDEWLDEARADAEAGCMFSHDAVRRMIGHIDVLTRAINARREGK